MTVVHGYTPQSEEKVALVNSFKQDEERHVAPAGGQLIYDMLHARLMAREEYTPYQNHLWYENLHPFTDGNGRSGRALWLYETYERGNRRQAEALGFLHCFYYHTLEAQDVRK